ncbi:anti-sigma factor antagonist [Kitasatospora sp. NPDC057223]|uniref:anti-sigma factor antagonist n=1 Tax=Kitasatospora sp. NPDC057223 TaxID=3346055 RepID=UPI00363C3B8F
MRLTIGRDAPDFTAAERAVSELLDTLPFGRDARHQVVVAMLEALSNAVRHGRVPGAEQGPVTLEAQVAADRLVLTVADDGPGFDPGACPDPRAPDRLLLPGGRGVFLMRRLMDSVDFAFPPGGGTRVTLGKDLPVARGGPSGEEGAMTVSTRQNGAATVLDLDGRITVGAGDAQLRSALRDAIEAGATRIVLNLAKVTAIDSSGVGELVNSSTTATGRGAELRLANVPSKVTDALVITRLITVFDVHDTEDAAVASF